MRDYNPLQTVRCYPLGVDNTDQDKNLVGNHIISLETLDELVAKNQIIFCCSLDQFARLRDLVWVERYNWITTHDFLWISLNLYDVVTVPLWTVCVFNCVFTILFVVTTLRIITWLFKKFNAMLMPCLDSDLWRGIIGSTHTLQLLLS